jgi:hypothetical protein
VLSNEGRDTKITKARQICDDQRVFFCDDQRENFEMQFPAVDRGLNTGRFTRNSS